MRGERGYGRWDLMLTHIVNVQYIRCGLPRNAWDTPPFLWTVSPTPPVQSVDAYTRSITWQPNEKRLYNHILWVWGSVPRTLRRMEAPLWRQRLPLRPCWIWGRESKTLHGRKKEIDKWNFCLFWRKGNRFGGNQWSFSWEKNLVSCVWTKDKICQN